MPDQHRDSRNVNVNGLGRLPSKDPEFSKDFLEQRGQEHRDEGIVSAHDRAALGEFGDLKISSPVETHSIGREDHARRLKSATTRHRLKSFAGELRDRLRSNLRSFANEVLGSEAPELPAKAGRTECLDFLKKLDIGAGSPYFDRAKQLKGGICRLMIR